MPTLWFVLLTGCAVLAATSSAEDVTETEMFSISITPKMFNWTFQEFDLQYTYHASLLHKPDLPDWLRYTFSSRHRAGFVYGTPPLKQKDIQLQVVALNKEDYETRSLVIPLKVQRKVNTATHHVQMKIDNLNVEDMLDGYRLERLKDVFGKKLWREAVDDISVTFLASAVQLGARLPLKPDEGEGVVLRLSSPRPHSAELVHLQEEVRPLAKVAVCPRDFKRTTVERLFRDAGFNLDWCAFRLVNDVVEKKPSFQESSRLRAAPSPVHRSRSRESVPERDYGRELTTTIVAPTAVMLLLLAILSGILCFHHEGIDEASEVFFVNIFHLCEEYAHRKRSSRNTSGDSKHKSDLQSADSLKPLHSRHTPDSASTASVGSSPCKAPQLETDHSRPQPPPYLSASHQTAQETLQGALHILNQASLHDNNANNWNPLTPRLRAHVLALESTDEDYVPLQPGSEQLIASNNASA